MGHVSNPGTRGDTALTHPSLPTAAFGAWVHAHEEDTETVRVYRARGTPLPPSRGREGFEIHRDGTFIYHGIAPTDGSRTITARWECDGDSRIRAHIPGRSKPYVISVSDAENATLLVSK